MNFLILGYRNSQKKQVTKGVVLLYRNIMMFKIRDEEESMSRLQRSRFNYTSRN